MNSKIVLAPAVVNLARAEATCFCTTGLRAKIWSSTPLFTPGDIPRLFQGFQDAITPTHAIIRKKWNS